MLAVLIDVVIEELLPGRVRRDDEVGVVRSAVGEDDGGLIPGYGTARGRRRRATASKSARQSVRWFVGSLMMAPELQTSGASRASCWAIGQARR